MAVIWSGWAARDSLYVFEACATLGLSGAWLGAWFVGETAPMSEYLRDRDVRILHGDAVEQLATLPDGSVDCCVTSPPYYHQRDYKTGVWVGGDSKHNHDTMPARNGRGGSGALDKRNGEAFPTRVPVPWPCSCGARYIDQQIGMEQTPAEYVAALLAVFAAVHRVLSDAGSLWINVGDSYAANRSYQVSQTKHQAHDYGRANASTVPPGCKAKDLIGIPWRLAFALGDAGWWRRSENIWWKPNALPESATDRPHRAHETVFQFTKRAHYYYDAEAVKEPAAWDRWGAQTPRKTNDPHARGASFVKERSRQEVMEMAGAKNLRSVWPINTRGTTDDHFAIMPPAVAENCILSSCPIGGLVLDPFAGTGTTGVVALSLGRRALLVELSETSCKLAADRLAQQSLLAELSA